MTVIYFLPRFLLLENSIYVDDMLFGSDDIMELRETRDQLITLMKGGFQLRKWAANSPILLDDIPNSHHELTSHVLSKDEMLKVLGLSWSPRDDAFGFVIASPVLTSPTRRSILSFVAKLYDFMTHGLGGACRGCCEDAATRTLVTQG